MVLLIPPTPPSVYSCERCRGYSTTVSEVRTVRDPMLALAWLVLTGRGLPLCVTGSHCPVSGGCAVVGWQVLVTTYTVALRALAVDSGLGESEGGRYLGEAGA